MDCIQMLKEQHEEVAALFEELEDAESSASKAELFQEIADKLAVHAAIEEQHFYPAVKARRTEDILLEALEEHLGIKRVIADLLAIEADDETFNAKMKVLKEQVEHHVEEEETDLFPKVRKLFDKTTLEALAQEMTATQEELIAAGEPRNAVPGETDAPASLG